jgi:hypothetical protein
VLSGCIVELLMPPDLAPVASAPSSAAAKVLADAVTSSPANNSEVILMFIRVRLHKMSRYLILVCEQDGWCRVDDQWLIVSGR